MLENTPHGKGVLVLGNGLGGGIQRAERGDKCASASATRVKLIEVSVPL